MSYRCCLDVKILSGEITHLLDPEVMKMQVWRLYGNENFMFDSGQLLTRHGNLNSMQLSVSRIECYFTRIQRGIRLHTDSSQHFPNFEV